MKSTLFAIFLLWSLYAFCQSAPVESQIFNAGSTATTSKVGVRIRAKSGTVQYFGVTFYLLYQSANASIISLDDNKLVSTFGWGTSGRTYNLANSVNLTVNNISYDKRLVYANVDETSGSNVVTLTTAWDTLLYVNYSNLQASYPQGGFAYEQQSAEALGVALTDPNFSNIPIDVTSPALPLGPGTVLPVTFSGFEVGCTANGTLIYWHTATEANNRFFEVEKSIDGLSWRSLNRITTSASANSTKDYQWTDAESGSAFYRIKQVDLNGTESYTAVKHTDCTPAGFSIQLFPVPTSDKLTVIIKSAQQITAVVSLIDNTGQKVMFRTCPLNKGSNQITLDVSKLAQGRYYLQTTSGDFSTKKAVVIVR
ncbi:T9SS type A sorting domain-containing protein [Flavisolibacter ginsenosidimutans]|nr:T9SS type A sorting domain-containing protein [Flavisolibacter ginsenosidimutans]